MSDKLNKVFEILDYAEFLTETERELFDCQPEFEHYKTLDIQTEKPIAIIFSSDTHFGSIHTNVAEIKNVLNTILENDNVFLAVNDDFIDNFETPVPKLLLAGINSQILSPAKQREFYKNFIELLGENKKLLAVVIGNHEEFSGQNPYIQTLFQYQVPLGINRLLLNLKLNNEVEYKIAMVHKSRFNSILNPVHSSHRELTLYYPTADVVCTSHTHFPAIYTFPYPKDDELFDRILIKTGTFKDKDAYTFKYFNPYKVSHMSTPAVVLYPNQRKMIGFFRYQDAVEFVRGMSYDKC